MSNYTVQISGKDISIEQSVDSGLADKIALQLITERVKRITSPKAPSPLQEQIHIEPEVTQPNIGIIDSKFLDFLNSRGPINSAKLVACLGLFLNEKGRSCFTKKEYRDYFKMVKGKTPTNAPRDFTTALARDWITERPPEQFKITSKGKDMCRNKSI